MPDLKLHNYAKITNTKMCLKTPGLDKSSQCLPQRQHGPVERTRKTDFPALACFMTLGNSFPILFPPGKAFWGKDLEQGLSCHQSGADYPTRLIPEVPCKSVSSCVTPTPTAVLWHALGTRVACPCCPLGEYKTQDFHRDFWSLCVSAVGLHYFLSNRGIFDYWAISSVYDLCF